METIQLPFNRYQKNIYSQNGEDGVIAEILRRLQLPISENWCVEFGAWDGKYLSNTFALVEKNNFRSVYIEGNTQRFKDLLITARHYPQITPVCAFVNATVDHPNCLDKILSGTAIPRNFAVLSIDVDSYDLDIWESLQNYYPKIVVIEINSGVPPGIIWRHSRNTQGNTFTATCNVGGQKGYTLVCHTGNLIFVRNDQLSKLNIEERYIRNPDLLFLFSSFEIFPGFLRANSESIFTSFLRKILPKSIRVLLKRLLTSASSQTNGL